MIFQPRYPPVPPIPDRNVHHIFFGRPDQESWPDFTLHVDAATGQKRRYRESCERIRDVATVLGSPIAHGGLGLRGTAPGDDEMVGILSENCMEYVILIHGLLTVTTPFVPLSCYSTSFELEYGLRLAKATRVFVSPKLLPLLLSVIKKVGISDKNVYVFNGHVSGKTTLDGLLRRVKDKNTPRLEVRPATKNTLAYLVFSSGTSGLPKAVMISHGNLAYALFQGITMAQFGQKINGPPPTPKTPESIPVALAWLPLHHTFGINFYSFRAFITPTTYIFMARWNLDQALELIPKYNVTYLTMLPSVLHELVNSKKFNPAALSTVTHMQTGAAYTPPLLADQFFSHLPQEVIHVDGYGQSEATIGSLSMPPLNAFGLTPPRGSAGLLLPGQLGRIIKDDGTEASFNEDGELWLAGGNIALGYWNNPEATKEAFVDGWFRTGDRFRADENGFFFFQDRTKDTLKISGAQVSPKEIEDTLMLQPDKLIADACVAGVSGGRTSDELIPRAWVVLSESGKKRSKREVEAALAAWIQKNLSRYKWLRGGIEFIDEIPKSPTGKVLRRVLKDGYEKHHNEKAATAKL